MKLRHYFRHSQDETEGTFLSKVTWRDTYGHHCLKDKQRFRHVWKKPN